MSLVRFYRFLSKMQFNSHELPLPIDLYFSFIHDKVRCYSDNGIQTEMGDGYGITWMYFPDGDDIPRRISLEVPPADFWRFSKLLDDGIEYRLYTKYNKENYVLLDESAQPVYDIPGNKIIIENLQKAPIKLVTHGWESSADKSAVINIKDAYLESQDVNVIGVDWSQTADSIVYPIVAPQTSIVGARIGKFIDSLCDRYNIQGSQIHLIGHSLGAHVMGNAGYTTKRSIFRITGLDPARPFFEVPDIPKRFKLDSSDAKFVDVIHTCKGILGVENNIGHADFYPNEGSAPQPGCYGLDKMLEACSHSRSHILYADSIRYRRSYPSFQCASWSSFLKIECRQYNTFMGEDVNRSAHGTFYLLTNSRMPYGRGLS